MLARCACNRSTDGQANNTEQMTWQEQYNLGIRYLSEGNYEEAIIAFTAAIEIDPKRAEAYVGRGDAYIGSGETEDNLTAAQADYEQAIELDVSDVNTYLKLTNLYIIQGEYDRALELLQRGLDTIGESQVLSDKLSELKSNPPLNDYGATEWIYREGYVDFDDMSDKQRSVIELAADAAMHGDYGAVSQMVNLISDSEMIYTENAKYIDIRSIWNGFKIWLYVNEDTVQQLIIEMRPENGIGYWLLANCNSGDVVAGANTTCAGEKWPWTGTLHEIFFDNSVHHRQETTGIMKNGLRDGTFLITITTLPETHIGRSSTTVYQNGICIEGGSNNASTNDLWTLSGCYPNSTLDDPGILDVLYW